MRNVRQKTRAAPVLPISPSTPFTTPLTPLPRIPMDPRMDPVRQQESRFVTHEPLGMATQDFAANAPRNVSWAMDDSGVAYPRKLLDYKTDILQFQALGIDLEKAEWDADTCRVLVTSSSLWAFNSTWPLMGKVNHGTTPKNFVDGLWLTDKPWFLIATLKEFGNLDPNENSEYQIALYNLAKAICSAVSDSGNKKTKLKPHDEDAVHKWKTLTRSPGISLHAEHLQEALWNVKAQGWDINLWVCKFGMKMKAETFHNKLMLMWADMEIEGDAAGARESMNKSLVHYAVDMYTESDFIVLAKCHTFQSKFEGLPANYCHYPMLGKLGLGFGGVHVKAKGGKERCESVVSAFDIYQGNLKHSLQSIKEPSNKFIETCINELTISRMEPDFQRWPTELKNCGKDVRGFRLEVELVQLHRNWRKQFDFLLPYAKFLLEACSFKLVHVGDYLEQYCGRLKTATEAGLFRVMGPRADGGGLAKALVWKRLEVQILRHLIGWCHNSQSKGAYLMHKADIYCRELKVTRSGPVYVNYVKPIPKPHFPARRQPAALEELLEEYMEETHEEAKEAVVEVEPDVQAQATSKWAFHSLEIPYWFPNVVSKEHFPQNLNDLPSPPAKEWRKLCDYFKQEGRILASTLCTGMELHALSTRVLWKIAPPGTRKTNSQRGWSALPIVAENKARNCGWLGSSLGEATINLYMKCRIEEIEIISK